MWTFNIASTSWWEISLIELLISIYYLSVILSVGFSISIFALAELCLLSSKSK